MKHRLFVVVVLLLSIKAANGFVSPRQLAERNRFHMSANVESEAAVSSQSPIVTPDMKAYSAGYKTVFEELPCSLCTSSEGTIPDDLVGTLYHIGPAMFSAGSIVPPKTSIIQPKQPPVPDGQDMDRMVKHPFDADGAVLAVSFANNTATTRYRYVRTNAFTNERKRGARLYKAMDSTREIGGMGNDLITPMFRHHLQPGLNKNRKNTSNSRIVFWAKKLISLWEGGLPYKLDDLAISTEGRSQLGGVLKENDSFGAKAAYDSKNNRMLFYSNKQDAKSSQIKIYEFNSKFRKHSEIYFDLPGFTMFSDFAATENFAIFVQPPVAVNAMQLMFKKEPGQILDIQRGASTLHLLKRDGSAFKSFDIPMGGSFDGDLQFVNAYEEDGAVIFDAIQADGSNMDSAAPSYPWATTLSNFKSSTAKRQLVRYTYKSGKVEKQVLMENQCYFGAVDSSLSAQKHTEIFVAVGAMGSEIAPPQGIAKLNVETGEVATWMPNSHEFCGGPMVAGDYVLTVLFNGQSEESEIIILSKNSLELVGRVPLGIAIPHGLHGCFSDDDVFESAEIDRRAKLADKMESRGNMWNEVKSDFSGLGLRLDDLEEYFGDTFL